MNIAAPYIGPETRTCYACKYTSNLIQIEHVEQIQTWISRPNGYDNKYIADWLNGLGIKTGRGKTWNNYNVSLLIKAESLEDNRTGRKPTDTLDGLATTLATSYGESLEKFIGPPASRRGNTFTDRTGTALQRMATLVAEGKRAGNVSNLLNREGLWNGTVMWTRQDIIAQHPEVRL